MSHLSQNCDNFLSERSSTRRHAPPGGQSQVSFIFGGGEEAPAPARQSRRAPAPQSYEREQYKPQAAAASRPLSELVANREPAQQPAQQQQQQPQKAAAQSSHDVIFGARSRDNSSNRFANGNNQNCGNYITDRATTRVHAPPGGASSFSLG